MYIYTALVSYPLASSSNSTTVLPQLYVLIVSFGVDPYITVDRLVRREVVRKSIRREVRLEFEVVVF